MRAMDVPASTGAWCTDPLTAANSFQPRPGGPTRRLLFNRARSLRAHSDLAADSLVVLQHSVLQSTAWSFA